MSFIKEAITKPFETQPKGSVADTFGKHRNFSYRSENVINCQS